LWSCNDSFKTLLEAKTGAKQIGKYPTKKTSGPPDMDLIENTSVQSKLVLLTLSFPRLRIIWSSSPYATAEIFADLKNNNHQPDPAKAVLIGAEDEGLDTPGVNAAAEELLRYLPGITAKNVRHVMNTVGSIKELCELDLAGVQSILGVDAGKVLHAFLHRGQSSK
jgi:DNA excision repair protein ERCC-4